MSREKANSIEKGRETIEFFLNWDAISDMSGKRPDEAIGYRYSLLFNPTKYALLSFHLSSSNFIPAIPPHYKNYAHE